ncbi:hypothetical protein NCU17277 [Neurospora crassa OR74A]|uniref:Uncharacterized protein n=1 Tax=Neurospora crassa (strain ATCC 24698 / 74-OR23-1A / CBS 708.71 / DSM 1257 / FGSC 987) TaxID=367110 RepID=V5IKR0_NEUCR|nr:hypothetical protein NCU17277 [Neurospora crassa OR74A]ESA42067.1 hypothetical protein NCU17277 [Neurospora crassa OR74A]|eukprot:XP_011395396.1 hypothetical protein NCU17277 [Neurospora crassa OR74A]
MTPPCQSFKAKALPTHIQVGPDQRVRKTEDGGRRRIDLLRDCELFGLLQYDCQVRDPELRESQIECWPVQRLFRRCRDKNGPFTVETTAWEGTAAAAAAATTSSSSSLAAAAAAAKATSASNKSSLAEQEQHQQIDHRTWGREDDKEDRWWNRK